MGMTGQVLTAEHTGECSGQGVIWQRQQCRWHDLGPSTLLLCMLEQGADTLPGEAEAAREGWAAHHSVIHRPRLALAEVISIPQNPQQVLNISLLALVQLIREHHLDGVAVIVPVQKMLQQLQLSGSLIMTEVRSVVVMGSPHYTSHCSQSVSCTHGQNVIRRDEFPTT